MGSLSVTGNVWFTGGEYKAKIVGDTGSTERNRWISSGTFTTSAAATITPVVSSGTLAAKVVNQPRTWNVITATLGFPAAAVLPTVGGGFASRLYDMRREFDLEW